MKETMGEFGDALQLFQPDRGRKPALLYVSNLLSRNMFTGLLVDPRMVHPQNPRSIHVL